MNTCTIKYSLINHHHRPKTKTHILPQDSSTIQQQTDQNPNSNTSKTSNLNPDLIRSHRKPIRDKTVLIYRRCGLIDR